MSPGAPGGFLVGDAARHAPLTPVGHWPAGHVEPNAAAGTLLLVASDSVSACVSLLPKTKPSLFHGTPLLELLVQAGGDARAEHGAPGLALCRRRRSLNGRADSGPSAS